MLLLPCDDDRHDTRDGFYRVAANCGALPAAYPSNNCLS